jgi:hypothetical protein
MAADRKNGLGLELKGSRGSPRFDSERSFTLLVYSAEGPGGTEGFGAVLVTGPERPTGSACWPSGRVQGCGRDFLQRDFEFLQALVSNTRVQPGFDGGLQVRAVLESVEAAVR